MRVSEMTEPATLKVPAAYYDEALAFCNARRAEKGLEPIAELPAGYAGMADSCPCASAAPGLHVWHSTWGFCVDPDYASGRYAPVKFVGFFDNCAARGVLTLPIRDPEGEVK